MAAVNGAAGGVVVTGMHRSGTSAVTGVLHALGLAVARGDDLMGPEPSNPAGHFESWSLTSLNDELLLALGGTWSAPPDPEPGWERGPVASSLAGRAAATFTAAHPEPPWVWKDPRTSLLLPFWQRVLGPTPVVVAVRHPAEVARSLEARDGLDVELGAALWFRYSRTLLASAAGLPSLVVEWDRLRDDPAGWTASAAGWLAELGMEPGDEAEVGIDAAVSEVRLTPEERRRAPFLRPEDHALFEAVAGLAGPHAGLPRLDFPPETEERRRSLADRRNEELRALLAGGSGPAGHAELRRYVARLEDELRRQGEAHAEITAYARHVEDELRLRTEAHQEVAAYVRHLEEQIRRKDGHIDDLTRRLVADQSSKKRS